MNPTSTAATSAPSILRIDTLNGFLVARFLPSRVVDPNTLAAARAELMLRIDQSPHARLVLDFRRVTAVTSAMVSLLLALKKRIAERHGRLVLVRAGDTVRQVLAMTKLERSFELAGRLTDVIGPYQKVARNDELNWVD